MPRRRPPIAAAPLLLLAPLALAGCGSGLSDATALGGAPRPPAYAGSIALASDPSGARCVLTNRETSTLVADVTTPATVPLPRSTAAIDATCVAPGSMETTVAIRPVRDFAANIHHPQPIGTGVAQNLVAVRSGITRRYDDTVVPLPPQPFASAAARDAWFADRAEQIRQAAAPGIARAERAQTATIDSADTLRGYLVEDLARLERQQAMATVAARTPR
ncbi:hypothetical protein GXW78_00640 [Roseomonas terrae]|uniref:Uncharacterized protein n=1 Tax=Neoroseomonas terrae TaxID=424799 RepID=A0ABS5EAV6_9PROT|nr:hypothetical protein [Neoroseomonas terrae]MBR0648154.1 hypothetical protein [Neoroseomonas terrae]